MRKRTVLLVVLVLVLISTFMAGCAPKNAADEWKWTPGKDEVTYKSTAADEWSPTFTVYVKIVGGNDTVLYDGKVTLTSPQMMASEFLAAAISEKGLAQEGLDVGFITKVGDYENDSTNNVYWLYYVNGTMPNWGTNEFRLRDGDYVKLAYEKYQQQ